MKNDIVDIIGNIKKIEPPKNPGQFNYKKYLLRKGIAGEIYVKNIYVLKRSSISFLEGILISVREKMNRVIEENIPERESGIIRKMFSGKQGSIEEDLRDAFCDAGVMHTLVVSGLHVGYVVVIFWFLLRWLPVGSKWMCIGYPFYQRTNKRKYLFIGPMGIRWLLLIFPLILYCFITGANPPVMRATLIVLVFIFCFLLGREKVVYHAFAFACLVILILDPQALFSASFQLSFSACLGIVFISPKLINALKKSVVAQFIEQKKPFNIFVRSIIYLFIVSLSAQIGIAPLLAKYFYKVSIVALISNLIVVPLVGIILWLCFGLFFSVLINEFLFAVSEFISESMTLPYVINFIMPAIKIGTVFSSWLVKIFIWLCYTLSWFLIKIVEFFATIPLAVIRTGEPGALFIVIYYISVIVIFKLKSFLHQFIGFAFIVLFFFFSSLITHYSLFITFLDVGLGDAIFIETRSGENIFIDCGGSDSEVNRYVLLSFLRWKKVTRIDKIFITTPKWTHYLGLKTLLEKFRIKEIFVCDENSDDYEFMQLLNLAKSKNVKIIKLGCYSKVAPFEIFYQKDEKCYIVKLSDGNFSALFTSDVSATALKRFIDTHKIEKISVFQYPAHGKRKIPQEILDKLNPKYVIISTDRTSITGYSTAKYGAISIKVRKMLTPEINFYKIQSENKSKFDF